LLSIYELHHWGLGFTKVASKRPRSIESVILDQDISEQVMNDMKQFQQSAEWYKSKGVPYRRGYLLYGPPGTGKTSFIQAIAGELKLNICYLNIGGDNIDDDGLMRALNDAPPRSIILLEDVDGIFVQREAVDR
jgi:chaperone BCS1